MSTPRPLHILVLLLGVAACSTAVILIKLSETPPLQLSGIRLILAALILSPLMIQAWKRRPQTRVSELVGISWPGALLLSLHLMSWTYGARMTSAASATLIVNLVPLAMPVLVWLALREHPTRREWTGTALALCGVCVLSLPPLLQTWNGSVAGDFICLLSMSMNAGYLLVARLRRGALSLWLYIVPLYTLAGIFCLALVPLGGGWSPMNGKEWLIMLGLAVIPTLLGHTALNYAMSHLRPQVVSVANVCQFLFAGISGYLIFAEIPPVRFLPASLLVILGALLCVGARLPGVRR